MNLELAGRVVLVTGGAKGIGAAITRALLDEGARPVIVDRDAEAAAVIAAERTGVIPIVADLRDTGACRDAVAEAVRSAGRLDAVVNNAGVNDGVGLERGDPERFRESLRTNLYHYYDIAHFALPHLKASRGGDREHRQQGGGHRAGQHLRLRRGQGRHPRAHARMGGRTAPGGHSRERRGAGRGDDAALSPVARDISRSRRARVRRFWRAFRSAGG